VPLEEAVLAPRLAARRTPYCHTHPTPFLLLLTADDGA
jgi:hypothetical protein